MSSAAVQEEALTDNDETIVWTELYKKDEGRYYAEQFKQQLSTVTNIMYQGLDNLDGFNHHFIEMVSRLNTAKPFFENSGGVPRSVIRQFVELNNIMSVIDKDYKQLPKGIRGITLELQLLKNKLIFFDQYKEAMDLYKEKPDEGDSFLRSLSDLKERASEKKRIKEIREKQSEFSLNLWFEHTWIVNVVINSRARGFTR